MKDIYLTSTFSNQWNIEFNPKIGEAITQNGITCNLPRKNINFERTNKEVFDQDIEGIKDSSIILAIAINETPNWGAEIGYAYGINKPILVLTDKNHQLPVICEGMITKTIRVENLDSIQEYIDSLVMEIKKLI